MKLMFEEQLLSQPANPDSSLVQHYVRTSATCSLIGNVTTRMALLDTGTQQFPVSITEGNEPDDNCYVVSPQTAYSGYAREELKRLSLQGFLIVQSAADVTHISWTHKHMDEVIDVLTQG